MDDYAQGQIFFNFLHIYTIKNCHDSQTLFQSDLCKMFSASHNKLLLFASEWSYDSRKNLELTAQTAFFLAIIIVQWADLIVSKTRCQYYETFLFVHCSG
jgi:hypothetical protein